MFKDFKKVIQDRLDFLISKSTYLYQTDYDKDELWDNYLDNFPPGTNEIFRERREYDCSSCRSFIKNYGGLVGIIDNKRCTIWDVQIDGYYQEVADCMDSFVKSKPITSIFYNKEIRLGHNTDREMINGEVKEWHHFMYEMPDKHTNVPSLESNSRQAKQVIQRSFEELASVDTVLDLIEDKLLYRGEEHRKSVEFFKEAKDQYDLIENKELFCWEMTAKHGRKLAIRNTAIGTLLIDLSDGVDVETAVSKYEKVVAPANYKRPKAIFTKKMIEDAKEQVEELGLTQSLQRRYARLEDVSVSDVIWASGEAKKVMDNPFDELVVPEKGKSFNHAQTVPVEMFIKEILPGVQDLKVLLENKHNPNLMSLIAPEVPNQPSLFNWDNGFSWAYIGGVTDSIGESVKKRGGSVDGIMRFSLGWAESDPTDDSDLDAHCHTPYAHIYYGNKGCYRTKGELDIDIQNPNHYNNKDIVENITFLNKSSLVPGKYVFSVVNYAKRGDQKGFKAEIKLGDKLIEFSYPKPLQNKEVVKVATVVFDGENFEIETHIDSEEISKKVWGVDTMTYVPVSTFMYSPNHWKGEGVGNNHYMFMLENCKNPGNPRGFFNEYLRNDLQKHKRVFEALGGKMRAEYSDNQLSGLGFSSTVPKELKVKADNKLINIKI